jgi:hypothetical protein
MVEDRIYDIVTDLLREDITKDVAIDKLVTLFTVGSEFYCQRDIEGESICDEQCNHCIEYYGPLEQD